MDYKVLYRKYRPKDFKDLVGQDNIKNILINSIKNNKIAHAYLFTGPRGTGKTSTAKIFARSLNCSNFVDDHTCGECTNCINFNTSPDIIELDAASNNGVDNIREMISNIEIAPTIGKYKIYIIDEVHMLTISAWNAFLKTLEEPPKDIIFILATTDVQKVPITVLSRCQRFDFSRIDRNLISENLKRICDLENIGYEENALEEIAYMSDGCMRDALSVLDQLSKVSNIISLDVIKSNYGTITIEDIDNLYLSIVHNDIDMLIENINKIKETGIDIKILINKLLDNFINKAVSMKKKNMSSNIFKQIKNVINSLNNLLTNINSTSNGFLLLELELISFINDEENQLTNREVNQIISREIIKVDTKIDVKNIIKSDNNKQKYKICDEFISIRINNSFVNANKEYKSNILKKWSELKKIIENKNINEFKTIMINTIPQVVGEKYISILAKTDSSKIIGNSKLYNFELLFNSEFKTNYKMIFINKDDFDNFMKTYSKDKIYEYEEESEFINEDSSSIELAENIFGNNLINLE